MPCDTPVNSCHRRGSSVGPFLYELDGFPDIARVRMQIRPFSTSTDVLYEFDSATGGFTIATPPTAFTLNPFTWEERAGTFPYDIWIEFADGTIQIPIQGSLTIEQNITEAPTP